MATDVVIEQERYRVRAPLGVFGLSLVTGGLYYVWWYWRVNDDARRYLRDYDLRPFVSFLAVAMGLLWTPLVVMPLVFHVRAWTMTSLGVGLLFLVMLVVSYVRTAGRVRRMQARARIEVVGSPIAQTLLLLLFPPAGAALLQAHVDRAWETATAGSMQPMSTPARPRRDNQVTPEDVGARVSFQFELPNGFTTEAVGTFERWDAGAETYFIRKKDGTEVRVPARGVRFGKVIPPLPTATGH
jgi:hypothetical protein